MSGAPLRVLFLAPSFLSRRAHKPIRGVEIFDLHLVRQMAELGVEVCVPGERYWRKIFEERFAGVDVETLYFPGPRKCAFPSMWIAWLLRKRAFDIVLLGNNSRGLLWGLKVLKPGRRGMRVVLLAHREAQREFLPAVFDHDMEVVAVSDAVARSFRVDGREPRRLETYYGIPNGELFTPADSRPSDRDGIVRFGVLGKLDNPWKGADLAIRAFQAMDADVRARAELHLAAYPDPPSDLPEGVFAHRWMSAEKTPEFLRALDVYLACSSGQETFGQTMVQAMLTGLAVIATGLEVHREKLDAGGGIVGEDERAISDAMERLAGDADERRRIGEIARATALERYVWDTGEFVERFLKERAAE